MSDVGDFKVVLVGSEGTGTNPGVVIGNNRLGWTDLFTESGTPMVTGAAGVAPVILGVANQASSGASVEALLSIDQSGNLGIGGALSIGGPPLAGTTTFASIGQVSGSAMPAASTPGSIYLRYDDTLGPRFYQYQYTPQGSPNPGEWLAVPVGLGIFNVKDYGAVGDGVADDTAAQQLAVNTAIESGSPGGVIYYPPGTYLTASSCIVVSSIPNGLVFAGAGPASIIKAEADQDLLIAPNGVGGLVIQDLQFLGPGVAGGTIPTSGAAMHFGGAGDFHIINVITSGTAFGLRAADTGGDGDVIGCSFNATFVGAYIASHARLHHCSVAGGTYGLIMDGAGVKMVNVDVFGALPIAMWNTAASSGANTFYGFDVEATFVEPPSGATGRLWPPEGTGSAYMVPNSAQLHLADCSFPQGTLIGGTWEGIPYVPKDVTINGGTFSNIRQASVFPSGTPAVTSPITNSALEIAQGTNVTVGGGIFSSPLASGYGINVGAQVQFLSILGNNVIAPLGMGAINLSPSGGVNCQDNLVSGAITWPAVTAQPFILANNPGFNPVGFSAAVSSGTGAGEEVAFSNDYGVPGTFYVSGGSSVTVSIFDVVTQTYNNTGVSVGGFHTLPGAMLRVAWVGSVPTVLFVSD